MKSTTYIVEITVQDKIMKSIWGRNSLACLLTLCQLRNSPCEFTKKCFAVFGQSNCANYFIVVLVTPIFIGIFFIPFMVWQSVPWDACDHTHTHTHRYTCKLVYVCNQLHMQSRIVKNFCFVILFFSCRIKSNVILDL